MRLRRTLLRWPLRALEPSEPALPTRYWIAVGALAALTLGWAALRMPGGVSMPLGLAMITIAAFVWTLAAARRRRRAPPPGHIEANDGGIHRVTPDGQTSLARWGSPFGVTLLACYDRSTALLAFTTPDQTRYVPISLDERDETTDAALADISALADLDLIDGLGRGPALSAADAKALLDVVGEQDREALGRAFLSDPRGQAITITREEIRVGDDRFDFASPLEWRPVMFHEATGQTAALYQATRLSQDGREIVLVAPMPASIVPREIGARQAPSKLRRALMRDLRLLQAPTESPPERSLRVAIDRPFMLAVRRALSDAPMAARVSIEPPKPSSEQSGAAP